MQTEAAGAQRTSGTWLGRALPAFLLAALLIAAFRGPLGGKLFYLRDISQNHYPLRAFTTERLRSGALPLWDPYHGGGTPLLANPDNLVLHPITLLFLLLPLDAAFTASILLQYALMAWGGYILARRMGSGREGATLAAMVLALSGPAASLASMQNVLCGAAWVPLGLWALLRGSEPGGRPWLALAAGCAGVVISVGEPASFAAFVLVGGALLLTARDTPGAAPRRGWALANLAWVVLAGGALAAAQILPAGELLALSDRGAGFVAGEGMKWSLSPARLPEIVVPRLFGDPTRMAPQSWWGLRLHEGGYPFLLTIYVGAIPCLLAAVALCHGGPGARRRRALGVTACAGLILALGSHGAIARLLWSALPLARQVRYPERFLLTALFGLALLAALGLDRLLDRTATGRMTLGALIAIAGLAFAAMDLVAVSPGLLDPFLKRAARLPSGLLQADTGAMIRGALLMSLLWLFAESAVLALGAGLLRAGRPARLAALPGWAIVAASGLSMTLAAAPARSTAAPGWLKAPSPLAGAVGTGPDAPRLYHGSRPEGFSVWMTTDELVWGYRFDRFVYHLGTGHRDHVPTIFDAAADRMDLKTMIDIGRALPGLPLEEQLKILALSHAGLLFSYAPLEHPDLEQGPELTDFSRPALRVYRLRSLLPRARFVASARPPLDPGDPVRSLLDPGFDPRTSVLIEAAPASAMGRAGDAAHEAGAARGEARIETDEPERIAVRVEAPASGYLVLADAYAPGWRARLDGAPAPVLKANGMFRAVALPPGAHEVIMTYRPIPAGAGLGISLVAFAATLAFAVRPRGRKP